MHSYKEFSPKIVSRVFYWQNYTSDVQENCIEHPPKKPQQLMASRGKKNNLKIFF